MILLKVCLFLWPFSCQLKQKVLQPLFREGFQSYKYASAQLEQGGK